MNIKEEKLIYLLNQNLFYFENVIKVIEINFMQSWKEGEKGLKEIVKKLNILEKNK